MNFEISGMAEIERKIKAVANKVQAEAKEALRDCAFDLLEKSKAVTPIDSGDLRASGHVDIEEDTATVGYNAKYATRQHEDLTYSHPRGGQAKYLENPYKENVDKYIKYIEDRVRRAT